jgi:hypothetical protein
MGLELQELSDVSGYMSSYAGQGEKLEILGRLIDTVTELNNGNISFDKESFNEKYRKDTNVLFGLVSKRLLNKRLSLSEKTGEVKYISVNMISDLSNLLYALDISKGVLMFNFEPIFTGVILLLILTFAIMMSYKKQNKYDI